MRDLHYIFIMIALLVLALLFGCHNPVEPTLTPDCTPWPQGGTICCDMKQGICTYYA